MVKNMALELQYPKDDSEIFYASNFRAGPYSVLAKNRTRNYINDNPFLEITLPIPNSHLSSTQQSYSEEANPVGPMLSAAGAANAGGNKKLLKKTFEEPFLMYLKNIASTTSQISYSNITELSLKSEARREFRFSWFLVPKDQDDAVKIAQICEAFRVYSYPFYAGSAERITPPALWTLSMIPINEGTDSDQLTAAWLGSPLVSVLVTVDVNKIPIDAERPTHYYTGQPVATVLSLVFKEFETGAIGAGGGIESKSEYATFGG
jgi:hypothetical protein